MSDVQIYNPYTAKYEAATDAQSDLAAEHKAQIAGEPAPGDRKPNETEADALRGGPVFTAVDAMLPGQNPGVAAHSGEAMNDRVSADDKKATKGRS